LTRPFGGNGIHPANSSRPAAAVGSAQSTTVSFGQLITGSVESPITINWRQVSAFPQKSVAVNRRTTSR
jgi:hypothetical protein